MDSMKTVVVVVFALGFVGCVSALPIAAFPGATFRSKSRAIRFLSKSAIFSLFFFISSVLAVIPLAWIARLLGIRNANADLMPWIYLLACVPIAAVLYRIYMTIVSAIYKRRSN